MLDFEAASGRTGTKAADALADHVIRERLTVQWVLETHVHADHLSAAPYLQQRLGGQLAIGAAILVVQNIFGKVSTRDRTSVVMAASLTGCSMMATPSPSATSQRSPCTPRPHSGLHDLPDRWRRFLRIPAKMTGCFAGT